LPPAREVGHSCCQIRARSIEPAQATAGAQLAGEIHARSQLKLAIKDVLDTGLPRAYDKSHYAQKCSALFDHIFESCPERDSGIYATEVHNGAFWEFWHEDSRKVLVIHEAETPDEKGITCRVVKNMHAHRDELRQRLG
jgi:hypothetical protein